MFMKTGAERFATVAIMVSNRNQIVYADWFADCLCVQSRECSTWRGGDIQSFYTSARKPHEGMDCTCVVLAGRGKMQVTALDGGKCVMPRDPAFAQ